MTAPVIKLADLAKAAPPYVLSADERNEIEHALQHYPDSRAASVDALKVVQKRHGYVPDAAIPAIAEAIGITAADLEGVATFYSLIFRSPVGRNVIKVCDSISCFLTGYDQLKAELSKQTGLQYGQTSADKRFTLLPICCLGACDRGPALMINDDLHGPLEPADVATLLEQYQ